MPAGARLNLTQLSVKMGVCKVGGFGHILKVVPLLFSEGLGIGLILGGWDHVHWGGKGCVWSHWRVRCQHSSGHMEAVLSLYTLVGTLTGQLGLHI